MHQLFQLLKSNRFLQISLGATAGIFILILIFSPKRTVQPPTPTRLQTNELAKELSSIPPDTRATSIAYRQTVASLFPITLEGFMTSPGIDTNLYFYILASDPPGVVRFEIFGLSYLNPDSSPFTNPNVTAFQESYQKGLSLLEEKGIDSNKLIFLSSDISYIRTTTEAWLTKLNLK